MVNNRLYRMKQLINAFKNLIIIVLLIIIITPSMSFAQIGDEPLFLIKDKITGELIHSPYPLGIHFFGSISLENTFRESLIIYRLGFAFHFDYLHLKILLDKEQNADLANYLRNWTSIRQYIAKIQSISYGIHNDTTFYFYLGEIYDFKAGPGTIIKYYTNATQSPVIKGVGARLGINFDFFRCEIMAADLISPDLFGSYLYVKPLKFFNIDFYDEWEIGVTFAIDFNPFEVSYYEKSNEPTLNEIGTTPVIIERWQIYLDGTKPTIDNIMGWSVYTNIPIYKFSPVDIFLLAEYCVEENLGYGFRVGVNGTILNVYDYKIDFLIYQPGFIPSIFFTQYENRKVNRYIEGLNHQGSPIGSPFGVYIELGNVFLPDRFGIILSFEDYFDDNVEGEIYIRVYIKEIIKGFGIELLINEWDVGYSNTEEFFTETADKTMWYIKIYYWLTPNARFSITGQKYFLLQNDKITKLFHFSIETLIYI